METLKIEFNDFPPSESSLPRKLRKWSQPATSVSQGRSFPNLLEGGFWWAVCRLCFPRGALAQHRPLSLLMFYKENVLCTSFSQIHTTVQSLILRRVSLLTTASSASWHIPSANGPGYLSHFILIKCFRPRYPHWVWLTLYWYDAYLSFMSTLALLSRMIFTNSSPFKSMSSVTGH